MAINKPRKPTRRKSPVRVKITKFHIFIMIALIVSVVFGLLTSLAYIFKDEKISNITDLITPNITANQSVNTSINATNVSVITIIIPDIPDETNKTISNATNETANQTNITIPPISSPPQSGKPKLVIIIDDVINAHQVNKIFSIPLKITPSFLPPKADAPDSPALAQKAEFYMVHLPSEALHFSAEPITLFVNDSYEEILRKLTRFKEQFPNAVYYNNHTGSKFTSSLVSMERLYRAMDELGLIFVDSRTTADTKAPQVAAKLGKRLLQRDVFLDNEIEIGAIKKQLNLAISKAKQNGFAIAIGHPHKETLDTLAKSLNDLKAVEVVYIKDL